MTVHIRLFDREKALEAILFVAHKLHDPTFHSISKMLYLADKSHLQDYGRVICGDRYIAMENGPVPSAIYDMMKVPTGRTTVDVDWDELIKEAFDVENSRTIVPKRTPDVDLLAQSETECLLKAIHEHGLKSFGQLSDLTHDSAWRAVEENESMRLDDIVMTLPNGEEVLTYLHSH